MAAVILIAVVAFVAFLIGKSRAVPVSNNQVNVDQQKNSADTTSAETNDTTSAETKTKYNPMDDYKPGIPEGYKTLPLMDGVSPKDVWTSIKPDEEVLYTTSATVEKVQAFYENKMQEMGWIKTQSDIVPKDAKNITLFQSPAKEGMQSIFFWLGISKLPPNNLPKDLNLQQQTFVRFSLRSYK